MISLHFYTSSINKLLIIFPSEAYSFYLVPLYIFQLMFW